MITIVRMTRVLLIVVLALVAISLVIGVGTPDTGILEKLVPLGLVGGCVYAAAKVTALADWAAQRLAPRRESARLIRRL